MATSTIRMTLEAQIMAVFTRAKPARCTIRACLGGQVRRRVAENTIAANRITRWQTT